MFLRACACEHHFVAGWEFSSMIHLEIIMIISDYEEELMRDKIDHHCYGTRWLRGMSYGLYTRARK